MQQLQRMRRMHPIGFRVEQSVAEELDAVCAAEQRPGLRLSRNDAVRLLMCEALENRRAKRRAK